MSTSNDQYTIQALDEEIARLRKSLEKYREPDDVVYYEREIKAVEKIKFLINKDCVVSEYGPGLILINDCFVLAYRGHKWRINGKARWYDYKSIEAFYTNNIERSAMNMTPSRVVNVIDGFKLTCEYDRSQHMWTVRNYKFKGEAPQLKEAVADFLHNFEEGKKNQIAQDVKEQENL